jgi:hypothetical protein
VSVETKSYGEKAMKESNRPGNISRRDTIRLLPMSATLVAGAVTAGAIPSAAWAAVSAPCGDAAHSGQRSADTTQDLAKLAAEHFEPLVGETFTIGDNEVTLRDVRHGPKTGSHFRQQFAVVFDAPPQLSIQPEPLPVSHPAIGRHDLLVSQIIDGRALEICFS